MMRAAIATLLIWIMAQNAIAAELSPGENFEEKNGLYDASDTLTIGYAGNVYRNCTMDGVIDIDIAGGNVAVAMKNVAVPGTVSLASGDILNAYYCAFAQTEAQIEASGGVVNAVGCVFNVANFGFVGSGDYSLLKTSILINAGTDLTAEGVTSDINWTSRPRAAVFDVGCYEYRFKIPMFLKP